MEIPKVGGWLVCPKCNEISVCDCEACTAARERVGEDRFEPHSKIDGDFIKCPYCGYVASLDEWEAYTYSTVIEKISVE